MSTAGPVPHLPGWTARPAGKAVVAVAVTTARLGREPLGVAFTGYGVTCWLVAGSILLARSSTRSALPPTRSRRPWRVAAC